MDIEDEYTLSVSVNTATILLTSPTILYSLLAPKRVQQISKEISLNRYVGYVCFLICHLGHRRYEHGNLQASGPKVKFVQDVPVYIYIYIYIYIYAQPPPQRPPSTRHLLHYA